MKFVEGGVCAAQGFKANGIHCGVRKNKDKLDLALIVSDVICNAAGVYTTNLVKGAPLIVSKKHLENGKAQAIICNSGNANTCNANGIEIAEGMANLVEKAMGISANDVIVGSTGVIGMEMSLEPFENGIDEAVSGLDYNKSSLANQAIMTRRKDLSRWWYCKGFWNDYAKYGNNALLPYNRCRNIFSNVR